MLRFHIRQRNGERCFVYVAATYRAVILTKHGGPEALEVVEFRQATKINARRRWKKRPLDLDRRTSGTRLSKGWLTVASILRAGHTRIAPCQPGKSKPGNFSATLAKASVR